MTTQPEPDSLRDQLCDAFIRLIRDYADRSIIAPGYMADTALAVVQPVIDEARATNQRLNYRAQQMESELAAYRRAVAQWEINERGTYIPQASLRTIGLASGKDILGSVRHLKHFERVEQAEAALALIAVLAFDANLRPDLRLSRIRNVISPADGPEGGAQ